MNLSCKRKKTHIFSGVIYFVCILVDIVGFAFNVGVNVMIDPDCQ